MKTFKQFINESNVIGHLKPKSDEEIKKIFLNKSTADIFRAIRKFDVPEHFLPTDEEFYNMIKEKGNLNELFFEILHHDMKYVKMFIDIYILPMKDEIIRQKYLNFSLEKAIEEVNPDAFEYLLILGADINYIKNTITNVSGPSSKKQKLKEIYLKYKNKEKSEEKG